MLVSHASITLPLTEICHEKQQPCEMLNALTDPAAIAAAVAQLVPPRPIWRRVSSPSSAADSFRTFGCLAWTIRCAARSGSALRTKRIRPADRTSRAAAGGQKASAIPIARATGDPPSATTARSPVRCWLTMPLSTPTRGSAWAPATHAAASMERRTTPAPISIPTRRRQPTIAHARDPWFAYGDASFGWNEYSARRHLSFTGFDRTEPPIIGARRRSGGGQSPTVRS